VKPGTRPKVETGLRKRINTTEMAADPPEPNGGYEGSRFNAVRHGVLSELTVLPWEDEAEYAKLLEALVEEYRPRGPTEDHLVEEIAGVIWRKRRLRLAEAGSYWKNVDRATDFFSDSSDEPRVVLTLDALLTTPAGTAKDIAEVQNRLTAVSRARDILTAGKTGAYKAAIAVLDERTKAHWQEQIAPKFEELDKIGDDDQNEPVKHYAADAAGLLGFLLCSVWPACLTQLGSLGIRSLIRAQVLGETLDFQRLEPISRYEVHLDRKFERAVSMLLRLRELR